MEQVRSNGEQKELRDEIVDLGTRYGIVTPYTSYLALEDARVTQHFMREQAQRRATTGGGGFGNANSANAPPPKVMAPVVTGAEAVQQSKMQREQQDRIQLREEMYKDAVRRVAGKTFYLVDGVWTDSEFKAESQLPETVLVFGSDEYFELLKQNAKLGSYFSLGQRVVVVLEGRVYRVNAK